MVESEVGGLKYFADPALLDRGVLVAFTTRLGGSSPAPYGSLNLSPTGDDDPGNIEKNLRKLSVALARPFESFVFAEQVHGHQITRVLSGQLSEDPLDRRSLLRETDGLLSSSSGPTLAILTADCLAVILVDPRSRVVAAIHAGWRGTLAGIVREGVGAMVGAGADVTRIEARLGPAIGPCCFQVGEDVYRRFSGKYGLPEAGPAPTLDLQMINKQVLLEAGVSGGKICTVRLCTKCRPDEFFSWRAEKATGRQAAIVSLL